MHKLLFLLMLVLLSVTSVAEAKDAEIASPLRKLGEYEGKLLVDPATDALEALRRGEPTAVLREVLLADGSTQSFQATRFDVFSPDAQILATDGTTTQTLTPPEVISYVGTALNDPTQSIYISVTEEDQLWMLVNGGAKSETNSFVAPEISSDGTKKHLLAKVTPADLEGFACGVESLAQAGEAMDKFYEPGEKTAQEKATATTLEAELLLDVGNALLNQRFGGNQNTAKSYVANLVGAVSSIYKRDINTVLTVKHLVIWTNSDPFGTGGSLDQLAKYRNYNQKNRSGTPRDLAHLLSTKSRLDGIAYVGALCSGSYGYGVTNLGGNANFNVSTYQWDIYALAHELGHNFNSPHTHCYSPPIDCCYASEDDCDQCSNAVPQTGSLMSYCHLNATINMTLHSRTINVMRNAAEAAACITAYVPPVVPEITVKGHGVEIHTNDSTPSYTDGTHFGTAGTDGAEVVRTFRITNTGTTDLLLDGTPRVAVSGLSAGDFQVVALPAATVAAGGESNFQVRFKPGAAGLRLATITVSNNDPNEGTYSFAVQGQGVAGVGPQVFTYTGSAVEIPDASPTGVMIPLTVSGVEGAVSDLNFRFDGTGCGVAVEALDVGVRHPYVGDLAFSLAAPNGTSVTLIYRRGASGDNFCQTLLDDEGGGQNVAGISGLGAPPMGPPYTGTVRPEEPLTTFKGVDPNGTWTLHAADFAASDVGAVRAFSLLVTGAQSDVPSAPNAAIAWGTSALQAPKVKTTVSALGVSKYLVKGTAQVANIGTVATDSATSVSFYLSSDAVADPGDLLVAKRKIGKVKPIVPGKPLKTKKVVLNKKATLSPSGKYLLAVVHANQDIEAANNVAVTGPLP